MLSYFVYVNAMAQLQRLRCSDCITTAAGVVGYCMRRSDDGLFSVVVDD